MIISDADLKPFFPITDTSEITVEKGGHAGLKCIPEGTPKPNVTWVLPQNLQRDVIGFFKIYIVVSVLDLI